MDDNKLNIKVDKKVLFDSNFELDECYGGLECLNKVSNNKYDLILMDITMPNMSGKIALLKLKEDPNFNIPVIAVTADAVSETKEKYINQGFVDYIAKPFNKEQIEKKSIIYLYNEINYRKYFFFKQNVIIEITFF